MSVGRIPVLIMGFSFEDALLVDFLAIWWCGRWEGRNLVVVELEWVDSFLLEDLHASYLAAQRATSSWKLLHHDGVFLGDCNISASSAWGSIATCRLHRYRLHVDRKTLQKKYSCSLLLVHCVQDLWFPYFPHCIFYFSVYVDHDTVTTRRSVEEGCHIISYPNCIEACRLHHVQVGQKQRYLDPSALIELELKMSYNRVTGSAVTKWIVCLWNI